MTAPAPAAPTRPRPVARWSTPATMALALVLLLVLGAVAGTAALVGVAQRGAALDDVRGRSGPLTVTAQDLYRALSDADATAATAFLSNGLEPPALRQQYLSDIAAASAALEAAVAADPAQPSLAVISARLPVYTGLVETARAYNRINLPIGAAYLREASTLMRTELLDAAGKFYDAETARLDADSSVGGGFPWLAFTLCLVLLVALGWAQVWLTRRTNRLVNPGLALASVLAVALTAWLGIGWAASASHLHDARSQGAAQVRLLSQARIDALRARADEALTLVARGGGAEFETDYTKMIDDLVGDPKQPGKVGGVLGEIRDTDATPAVRAAVDRAVAAIAKWHTEHGTLRQADQAGRYADAVALAIGSSADSGTPSTASLFREVDGDLAAGIAAAHDQFDRQASGAGGALAGEIAGFTVLTLLLLAAAGVGIQRRIAEYR